MSRSNSTSLNLLCSYAHLYRNRKFDSMFFSLHRQGAINAMVDSGAFTKLNAKSGNWDFINVDTYSGWIAEREDSCEKYVMLDVIGRAEPSRRNYETMVARGLRPMYVLTAYDNDWDYLRHTMDVNPNCCVAGGTVTKGDWLRQRFQQVHGRTGGRALIHGLGYVTFPAMLQLPLASVDSSSWLKQPAYGIFVRFDSAGLHSVLRRDMMSGRGIGSAEAELLDSWEVAPKDLARDETWRGQTSVALLASLVANLRYQRYVQRQGLRFFMAITSARQIDLIRYVDDSINTITYEKFRKFVRRNSA